MISSTGVWLAFAIYMVALISLGIYANRKTKQQSIQTYFTGKGEIRWYVLLMTYVAALMSTWVFFAGPGGYYRGGFVYWISELSYIPLFPVITYFVMNKVWLLNTQRGYVTPADLYDDRFKSPALRLVLGIVFMCVSLPYVASIFIACGRAAVIASGNDSLYMPIILFVGATTIVFICVGGMKSVAWADTGQGLLFIGALWAVVIAAIAVGFKGSLVGAFDAVWENTNSWFSYPGPNEWVPYTARMGYPLSCAIGWTIMLPHVFIRSGFSGDDLKSQKRLMFLTPVLQTVVWTGTMLIGLVGIGLLPDLTSTDTELIIPYLINNVIATAGTGGAKVLMMLFMLGAMAVGLSTANGFLLVSGSIFSNDFLTNLFKVKASGTKKMVMAKIVISIMGVISIVMALNPPELIWTLIMFAIAMVMPLFPVLVAALYWKRTTAPAAVAASAIGCGTVLLTYALGEGGSWYGFYGMAVSTVLIVAVSMITKPVDRKVLDSFYGALHKAEKLNWEDEEPEELA
ncbi:MAG: sodium:solute symporter family protein [Clostridiales Family XIII bacterium]|jgi:Na+/proline symporter|nr:sodium:solute symporter family protein [Clostridiales Family XIII bacterium]